MTFIDFQWRKGWWTYKSLPATLFMNDVSGERLPLKWLEPHEAERKLGIHLSLMAILWQNFNFTKNRHCFGLHKFIKVKPPWHLAWINFKMVLLKKVEYPLMVSTFLHSECNAILCLAMNAVLPMIGINHQFPRDMVFGHSDHFGLAIPHLYDSQGFLHLSALIKFGPLPCTTGQLICQSYETLQVKLGLVGELLNKKHSD